MIEKIKVCNMFVGCLSWMAIYADVSCAIFLISLALFDEVYK